METTILLTVDPVDSRLGTGDIETRIEQFFDLVNAVHRRRDLYYKDAGFDDAYVLQMNNCNVAEVVKAFREIDWVFPQYAVLLIRHARNDPGTLHVASQTG